MADPSTSFAFLAGTSLPLGPLWQTSFSASITTGHQENFLADTKKIEALFRCFLVISLSTGPVHLWRDKKKLEGCFVNPFNPTERKRPGLNMPFQEGCTLGATTQCKRLPARSL